VLRNFQALPHIDANCFNPYLEDLNWSLESDADNLSRLKQRIRVSSGVILTTPEYHGSYSSTLKWIIDHLGYPSVLSQKPVGLIGVASGELGAVKALEHLRGVCAHIGAFVMPKTVSIPKIERFIDDPDSALHQSYHGRIQQWVNKFVTFSQNQTPQIQSST
jgi:NAD(P)H-dependent FMN reductase